MTAFADPTTELTIAEILEKLTPYTGRFPKAAVEAAMAHRETITPHLLKVLEDVGNAPAEFAGRKNYMLHEFALYLLAQFREKRAFTPLVRILNAPGEIPFDLFGDTITGALKKILASIYDGDPAPLQRLIEDGHVNEYVRGAAIDAFLVLVHSGQMPREQVASYFRSLFQGRLAREHNHAWNSLACAIADLPAPELLEDLRRAYEEGLVDPGFAGFEELERDARLEFKQRPERVREQYALMGDAVSEMEWWAAFKPDVPHRSPETQPPFAPTNPPAARQPATARLDSNPSKPITRAPKVGRNDPCPCGSGKKFKKCCLHKSP